MCVTVCVCVCLCVIVCVCGQLSDVTTLPQDIFATKDEFRAMFNHSLLDKVRRRLNAEDAFPEVYDKVGSFVYSLTHHHLTFCSSPLQIRPEAGIVDLSDIEAEGKTNGKH